MCIIQIKRLPIIDTTRSLSQQFKDFYKEHTPANYEDAVEKFAIFGGVGWGKIDTTKPSFELIEELILKDYSYIRSDINELTGGMPLHHSILSAVALSDGKEHAVYKRARVEEELGKQALSELVEKKILKRVKSQKEFTSWSDKENIDDRYYFTSPFIRFWFSFVSPLFKGVRDGDFSEVKKRWENREHEFINLTFVELSQALIEKNIEDAHNIANYFDRDVELDIFTKTDKIIVGAAKYTNNKVKKSELTKLQELSQKAGLHPDIFVIVAKKGFSTELKALKGEHLKLFTLKSFKTLVE